MVYGKVIEDEEVSFKFEFDVGEIFSERDVFYINHKLGVMNLLTNMHQFINDKEVRRSVLKRDKETEKLFRKYKRYQEKEGIK